MSNHLTAIRTEPDWYEPYAISQAIRAGNTVYVSGQAGIDEHGRTVSDDFETQMRQSVANIERVLAEAGATLRDIVKVTIMVTDMANLESVVKIRKEVFDKPYPADNLLQVAALASPEWKVEIDAVAVVPETR
ncbi:RidA family protein [Glycomyces buryatensis]|uniref:RidA family protein n=1 Tax=Glycomyces buryatensis TaxID=2570927 RepID=A0A4S8QH03_9ACTN|nr:RidA family protein [Glycomyces buryatensis]THV40669.1 RidA family protein [Glycomyces buryatensis]